MVEAATFADLSCQRCHNGKLRRFVGETISIDTVQAGRAWNWASGEGSLAVCLECGAYHVLCPTCSHPDYTTVEDFDEADLPANDATHHVVLCRFAHADWEVSSWYWPQPGTDEWKDEAAWRAADEAADAHRERIERQLFDGTADLAQHPFFAHGVNLTGDDGGFTHAWWCARCRRFEALTDK